MNWQKMSIERLNKYQARQTALESLTEQIKTLEQNYTAIRSATTDGTPTHGGHENKREEMLIGNIATREELQCNYEIAAHEVEITEKALATLTQEQQRILYKFYIMRNRGHVEDLCQELCVEKSRVYTLKDEALKKFTIACYGVVEI